MKTYSGRNDGIKLSHNKALSCRNNRIDTTFTLSETL